jgi:hypothetical protein
LTNISHKTTNLIREINTLLHEHRCCAPLVVPEVAKKFRRDFELQYYSGEINTFENFANFKNIFKFRAIHCRQPVPFRK